MFIRLAKIVKHIVADYIYDPEHKKQCPGSNYHRTKKGWSDRPLRSKAEKNRIMNPRFKKVDNNVFAKAISIAKSSRPERDRWRVDAHDANDYKDCKNFVTTHGSTVSVKPDGDIISVCKTGSSKESAKSLLRKAISEGGNKLDAFGEELFNFYTSNGFRPVALTEFNTEYAPDGWKKEYGKQPIIFYALESVDKPYDGLSYKDFIKSTTPMEYDEAAKFRDEQIKKVK